MCLLPSPLELLSVQYYNEFINLAYGHTHGKGNMQKFGQFVEWRCLHVNTCTLCLAIILCIVMGAIRSVEWWASLKWKCVYTCEFLCNKWHNYKALYEWFFEPHLICKGQSFKQHSFMNRGYWLLQGAWIPLVISRPRQARSVTNYQLCTCSCVVTLERKQTWLHTAFWTMNLVW